MLRRLFYWFFRNRRTGEITLAQAPNLALWIVIAGSASLWIWRPSDRPGLVLEVLTRTAVFVWAADEMFRGVNPWRRCLGVAVLGYEFASLI